MLIFFAIIVIFAEIWIHESMQLTLVSEVYQKCWVIVAQHFYI